MPSKKGSQRCRVWSLPMPSGAPHSSHQNQEGSATGSLRAVQNQWKCLQTLEALVSVSMPVRLWPAISRISLVSSESSAGNSDSIVWVTKTKRKVSYSPLCDSLFCLVQFKATVALTVFNGSKWFNESGQSLAGHLGTGLPSCKLAGFPICSVQQ